MFIIYLGIFTIRIYQSTLYKRYCHGQNCIKCVPTYVFVYKIYLAVLTVVIDRKILDIEILCMTTCILNNQNNQW